MIQYVVVWVILVFAEVMSKTAGDSLIAEDAWQYKVAKLIGYVGEFLFGVEAWGFLCLLAEQERSLEGDI
jgi:hypothetical protein